MAAVKAGTFGRVHNDIVGAEVLKDGPTADVGNICNAIAYNQMLVAVSIGNLVFCCFGVRSSITHVDM